VPNQTKLIKGDYECLAVPQFGVLRAAD
jgi:hypothetical protein